MKLPAFCIIFTYRPRFGDFIIRDCDSHFNKFKNEKHLYKYYKEQINNIYSEYFEKIEMFVHGQSIGGFYFHERKE